MTADQRMVPDFMIAGFQKCGTTSLFSYLVQHPEIAPPLKKEIKYFDLNSSQNINWYKAHFPKYADAQNDQKPITGEATPDYIFFPEIAAKIARLNSRIKLIIICRNPVDRAFSQYKYSIWRGTEYLSFAEALEKEPERLAEATRFCRTNKQPLSENWAYREFSYVKRGLYAQQLENWLKVFPENQFLFLCTEELKNQPDMVLKKITDFLGIADFTFCTREKYLQSTKAEVISPHIRQNLTAYFEQENLKLFKLIGKNFGW